MKIPYLDFLQERRFWVLLLLYTVELAASLWLAYELRFDFLVDPRYAQERIFVLTWLVPLQLILLGLFQQLNPLLGYFSTPDLGRMFHALIISSILVTVVWIMWGESYAPPRGVIGLDFVFCLVGLTGVRLCLRMLRESVTVSSKRERGAPSVSRLLGQGMPARSWRTSCFSSRAMAWTLSLFLMTMRPNCIRACMASRFSVLRKSCS